MVNESDESFTKQNIIQDENWRKHCENILKNGIGVRVHGTTVFSKLDIEKYVFSGTQPTRTIRIAPAGLSCRIAVHS